MNTFGGTAWQWRMTLLLILVGTVFAVAGTANAATLYVTPASGNFAVGQVFNVVVKVNSQGTAINASEGVLSFNPAQLQVQSITLTGSIFNLNVQEPEFSNTAGTVRWTGVILNPGYTGTSGSLITIRFKGVVSGTTSVKYTSGAVLANDGAGTNVLAGLTGGTYTIGPVASPTAPTPTVTVQPSVGAPIVKSPTHPDPLLWYSNNDPVFQWTLPAGVDGVSYLINEKPDANPGNASDGLVSEAQFTDVPEGATYFHVKFRSGGVWGPIAHFPFNSDTIAPDPFSAVREDAEDTKNPRPLLSFSTTDSGSGVMRYMMKVGDGEWFEVPAGSEDEPSALPLLPPGSHAVEIEAIDRAGNSTRASLLLTVAPITQPVIVEYPPTVKEGETFMVSGTSDPNVTVRLEVFSLGGAFGRLLYTDAPQYTVDVKSDAAGRWSAQVKSLPSGQYRLQATAIDDRGAMSYPSEPVLVQVGFGLISRIVGFFSGLFLAAPWLVWILRAVFFALLLMLISFIAHCRDWRFWLLVPDIAAVERKESSKLIELANDISDELGIIAKVSQHRPLYPEEKYLKSKLLQYQKTVKVLLRDPRSRLAKRK